MALWLVPVANAQAQAPADSSATDSSRAIHWHGPKLGGRPDLYQHASLAFASGLAVGLVSEQPAAAAGTAVSLGVFKELLDGRVDRSDLAADLVGAALAALLTHLVAR